MCIRDRYYEGLVKKDPVGKEEIVVAAFTGNNDFGFPNNEITDLSLIHISEPTRLLSISYAVFCLKKKKNKHTIYKMFFFFFFNDTATTEIYTRKIVGSVRCV